jgi:hypothetical protein
MGYRIGCFTSKLAKGLHRSHSGGLVYEEVIITPLMRRPLESNSNASSGGSALYLYKEVDVFP